jgi:peptidoglycan/LPS O-acetylase OafA/YrhL
MPGSRMQEGSPPRHAFGGSGPPPGRDPGPLNRALRRSRAAVLVMALLCGVVIALQPGGPEPPPDPRLTPFAVVLAVVAILARRFGSAPRMGARGRVALTLTAYVCAAGLALLGVVVAVHGEARGMGLAFAAAAAIFCLPPPPRIGPPPPQA